ncbi:MAG: hypothetical protein ACTSXA_03480 [Candidatus Heimdallarchaeota archaeon]
MLEIITLIVGIVLCLLGIFMLIVPRNFIVSRYEGFHKAIRRNKEISVEKERLAKFYAILYFVLAVPLLTLAIIGFTNKEIFDLIYIWLFVAVATLGLIGILYCNLSKRFIKLLENPVEPVSQE